MFFYPRLLSPPTSLVLVTVGISLCWSLQTPIESRANLFFFLRPCVTEVLLPYILSLLLVYSLFGFPFYCFFFNVSSPRLPLLVMQVNVSFYKLLIRGEEPSKRASASQRKITTPFLCDGASPRPPPLSFLSKDLRAKRVGHKVLHNKQVLLSHTPFSPSIFFILESYRIVTGCFHLLYLFPFFCNIELNVESII